MLRFASTAGIADRLNVARGCLIVDVGDQHTSTVLGQASGGGSADTHGPASNDCYLICEVWQRWFPLCVVRL